MEVQSRTERAHQRFKPRDGRPLRSPAQLPVTASRSSMLARRLSTGGCPDFDLCCGRRAIPLSTNKRIRSPAGNQ